MYMYSKKRKTVEEKRLPVLDPIKGNSINIINKR
jgi:hypothetical protein